MPSPCSLFKSFSESTRFFGQPRLRRCTLRTALLYSMQDYGIARYRGYRPEQRASENKRQDEMPELLYKTEKCCPGPVYIGDDMGETHQSCSQPCPEGIDGDYG